ncbi:placenta-specific gene 8 protein-like [Sorex fumeus]|uniref:placenta-specific gene 8 protein-like n=1 Tax=Sorex fumeus TaxID=62283 RepID=UPI0024AE6774|nr:placenta-specific gene 8 protein-like [Sorex fumeus]
MQAPAPPSHPVVIVTQPNYGAAPQMSNWQTGILDCFSDFGVCLCGMFCFEYLACQVATDMGECCLCGTSVAMRTLYRTRYGIPGSICNDFLATYFCPLCSLCQIKRDINRRRAMRAF